MALLNVCAFCMISTRSLSSPPVLSHPYKLIRVIQSFENLWSYPHFHNFKLWSLYKRWNQSAITARSMSFPSVIVSSPAAAPSPYTLHQHSSRRNLQALTVESSNVDRYTLCDRWVSSWVFFAAHRSVVSARSTAPHAYTSPKFI